MNSLKYKQFLFEKELAIKLSKTNALERKTAYKKIYGEFYARFQKNPIASTKNIHHKIEWQLKFLKLFLKKEFRFLEIGAGNCLLSLEVSKHVKNVIAYEVAESVPYLNQSPENFSLKVFDGLDFNEPDNSIDIIYSNDVFEHIHVDDTTHHAIQYYKMLNKGGKLIIITPHSLTGPHDISRDYSNRPEGFHMKEYTFHELRDILVSIGFKKIQVYTGHKKFRYFAINIWILIFAEKVYKVVPLRLRYILKNNFILQKIFSIKIVGEK